MNQQAIPVVGIGSGVPSFVYTEGVRGSNPLSPTVLTSNLPILDTKPDTKSPRKGFGAEYKIDSATGCWAWQRSIDKDGYGYFRSNGKIVRAHRYFYERKNGPLPPGTVPDHKCRNRACVNPDHIEAVTHAENCRRGDLVKTGMAIYKARRIRSLRLAGVSYKKICEEFGIGTSLAAQIITNRCWKDNPGSGILLSSPTPIKAVAVTAKGEACP